MKLYAKKLPHLGKYYCIGDSEMFETMLIFEHIFSHILHDLIKFGFSEYKMTEALILARLHGVELEFIEEEKTSKEL